MGRAAVLLDRDGVLNEAASVEGTPRPPSSVDDFRLLPGTADACHSLHSAGLLLIVVTNQPDVARGATTRQQVEEINLALREALPVDDVFVCWHDDGDGCDCRKPLPGLLLRAADRWGIDLTRSVMVGDRWRDVEAGRSAGCATVFVDHGWTERAPQEPDLTVGALVDAVGWILDRLSADPAAHP